MYKSAQGTSLNNDCLPLDDTDMDTLESIHGLDKGSQYCIRPAQGAFMNRDIPRLETSLPGLLGARAALTLSLLSGDSTQSITLVGVLKHRVQSDHASFTEASGQKGPTKGSLGDIMSEGESFGHEPTAKRKRALVIHHRRQCRSQTLARSLKTHLTNISSV
ncbi:unnamed protein product [Boreogadus saida]